MKKLFILLYCLNSALSYGQQASSYGQQQSIAAPPRSISRTHSHLERRSSSSITASAPGTPLSSSPNDRHAVSFANLAAHVSTSEPSSPRPPVGTAPTPLNVLIREQDRAAAAAERQAAAFERIADVLERLMAQGEASIKLLRAVNRSVEALALAHIALHDDEDNLDEDGQKTLLRLNTIRHDIIAARPSGHQ